MQNMAIISFKRCLCALDNNMQDKFGFWIVCVIS